VHSGRVSVLALRPAAPASAAALRDPPLVVREKRRSRPAHRPASRLRWAIVACEQRPGLAWRERQWLREPGPGGGGGGRPFGHGQAAAGPSAAPVEDARHVACIFAVR